jgi:hypothetical protein
MEEPVGSAAKTPLPPAFADSGDPVAANYIRLEGLCPGGRRSGTGNSSAGHAC